MQVAIIGAGKPQPRPVAADLGNGCPRGLVKQVIADRQRFGYGNR